MDSWLGKLGVHLLRIWSSSNSATLSHSHCGLSTWVEYHIFSDPGPRHDHLPGGNLLAYVETRSAFALHSRSLFSNPHEMSLNIDMKMIRPLNSDGSLISDVNSWTLLQSSNVVNPGKYSTRIPSAHHQLCPKFYIVMNSWTNSIVLPKQNLMLGSDSSFQGKPQNLKIREPSRARDWWLLQHYQMTVSWKIFPVNWSHSIKLIWLSDYQLFRYVEHLFHCEIVPCIFDGMQNFWVILSHEYRCFHCWRHEHSPISFACKNDRDFNERSDSVRCWNPYHRHQWQTCLCAECSNGWLFTHTSPRSCFQHFIRISLLRRPLHVSIPFWEVWWRSAHHRSLRSWLLLIPRAQRYVTFISGCPRDFWCNRGNCLEVMSKRTKEDAMKKEWQQNRSRWRIWYHDAACGILT